MRLFTKVHWSIQSPRISPLSVEALPTSTDEVPWLPSQCLCNAAAAAAAVSSHILSSGEKHEICSIQRTRQRKKNLPPARLSIYLVPECVPATQPQLGSGPDSPHERQGGPISRLNGPLRCWCWGSTQGWVGAARNISDILRRQAEVSSPPRHQRQTSNPRKLM